MKSKFTKILCLVMGAILLVTGTVAVTLAYLKAETDPVTNTMTVGKVEIKLDEAAVNLYGDVIDENADRVTENEYRLVPGEEYVKDPMITVAEDSEKCYVYFGLYIDPKVQAVLDTANNVISDQIDDYHWIPLVDENEAPIYYYGDDGNGNRIQYTIYRYETVVDPNGTAAELHIFDKFTVASNAVIENAAGKIMLKAFAVQAANLTSPLIAWRAAEFSPVAG